MKRILLLSMLCMFMLSMAFSTTVLNDSVAYYAFDENSTGANFYGNMLGANGTIDGSMYFDGVDDYVDTNYELGTNEYFSISTWVYLEQAGAVKGRIYNNYAVSNGYISLRQETDGNIILYTRDSNVVQLNSASLNVNLNQWYLITVTRDPSVDELKIYLDGTLQETIVDTRTGYFNDVGHDFELGRRTDNNGEKFKGKIDDFVVFNRTITSSEVTQLYNSGTGEKANEVAQDFTFYMPLDYLYDSSLNDNQLTQSVGNTVMDGKLRTSPNFDGSDDYVSAAPSIPATSSFSVTGFFNIDVLGTTKTILYQGDDGTGNREFFSIVINSDNTMSVEYDLDSTGGTTSYTTTTTFLSSTWYHFAFIKDDSGTDKLYINGILETSGSTISGSLSQEIFEIGVSDNWFNSLKENWFDGKIDEVSIYDRVLNSTEISQLYNNGTGLNPYKVEPPIPTQVNPFLNISFFETPITDNMVATTNNVYWNLNLLDNISLTNFSVDFNNNSFEKFMDLPLSNKNNLNSYFFNGAVGGFDYYDGYYYLAGISDQSIIKFDNEFNYITSVYPVDPISGTNIYNVVIVEDYLYVYYTDFTSLNYMAKYDLNLTYQNETIDISSIVSQPTGFYYDKFDKTIFITDLDVGVRNIYELDENFNLIDTYIYDNLSSFRDLTRYNNNYYIMDNLELKKYDLDFTYNSTIKNLFSTNFCSTSSQTSLENIGGILNIACGNSTQSNYYKFNFEDFELIGDGETYYTAYNLDDGDYTIQFRVENSTEIFNSSIYSFSVDATDPIITNTLPNTTNSYYINISDYVTCTDNINLLSCKITFDKDNQTINTDQATLYNFTYNGNQTYTIVATDVAGNSINETGIIFVNPYQYFRFNDSINSLLLEDYIFGSYSSNNTYITIPIYDLGLNNHTLQFSKFGYTNQNFTFEFTNTSRINVTYNVTPTTLSIRMFKASDLTTQLSFNVTIQNSTDSETYLNQLNFSKQYNETITGDITIYISSQGYADATYYNTLNDDTSISITGYLFLTNNTDTEVVQFFTRETGTDANLANVLIEAQLLINGSFTTITQATTDDSGSTFMWLDTLKTYKFIFSKNGYVTATANSIPSINSYTIKMERDVDAREYIDGINIMFSPSSQIIQGDTNQTFKVFITGVSITSMTYELLDENGTVIYTDTSTNPTGTTFENTLNISNYDTLTQRITYLTDGTTNIVEKEYRIINIDSTNFLSYMKSFGDTTDEGTNIFMWIVMLISIGGAFMIGSKFNQPSLFVIATAGFFTFVNWMPSVYFGIIAFTAVIFWMAFGGNK